MKYLIIDASLSGTGVRNQIEGGYILPTELGISELLVTRISNWLKNYELEHYRGYSNKKKILLLDEEGRAISRLILSELPNVKVKYFSDAKMEEQQI